MFAEVYGPQGALMGMGSLGERGSERLPWNHKSSAEE